MLHARRPYVLTPARSLVGRSSAPGHPPVGLDHPDLAHEIAARSGEAPPHPPLATAAPRTVVHDAEAHPATETVLVTPPPVEPPGRTGAGTDFLAPAADAEVDRPAVTLDGTQTEIRFRSSDDVEVAMSPPAAEPRDDEPVAEREAEDVPAEARLTPELDPETPHAPADETGDELTEPSWTEIAAAALPLGAGAVAGYHLGTAWGLDALTGSAVGGAVGLLAGWACYTWFTRRRS